MTVLDEKINQGYGKVIIEAFAFYFKLPESAITVANDPTAKELTRITLSGIDATATHLKLRLQELERHEKVIIVHESRGIHATIALRMDDDTVEAITQKQLAKKAARASD